MGWSAKLQQLMLFPSSLPGNPPRRDLLVLQVAGLWLTAVYSFACGGAPDASQPPEIYRVRGMIRQLPVPQRANPELMVRHEAIPNFKDTDGEVVGMESMTMPFPLAEADLLVGLEVGDRIEIDFEMRWDGGHPVLITAIERLPPETRLSFEADASDE